MLAPARGSRALFSSLYFVPLLVIPMRLVASPQPQANSAAAVSALTSRANSKDVSAQRQLAQFLIHSDPATPGYDLAVAWLQSFASRNIPQARFLLGYLYEQGHGLPRDYAKAAENYRAAALQGLSSAQNNLADLYQRGLGVPKDDRQALELYTAGAQQGNPVAQVNLASMFLMGSAIQRDFSQAARWFRAAAEHGYAPAQHALAILESKGEGVPIDRSEAARWERLAARQGYPSAETGLAHFYETGEGVPLDYVSAYDWYFRAMAAGDPSAAAHLKELAQLMTRKQLEQAKAILSAESSSPPIPPNSASQGGDAVVRGSFESIASSETPESW